MQVALTSLGLRLQSERANLYPTAQVSGRIVENSKTVSHEEGPVGVENDTRAKWQKGRTVLAVKERRRVAGAGMDVSIGPQPDLVSSDRDAGFFFSLVVCIRVTVHRDVVCHQYPQLAVFHG